MAGVMAIDPGLTATGAVVRWRGKYLNHKLRAAKGDVPQRIHILSEKLAGIFQEILIGTVVIEVPEQFSSAVGIAASKRGDIIKLAMLTGAFIHVAKDWNCIPILVTPRDWKQQLPKKVSHRRIKKRYSKKIDFDGWSEHEIDALGILTWWRKQ